MATTISSIRDEVRRRLRDSTTAPAFADNTVFDALLVHTQHALNAALNSNYGVSQMSTVALRLLYDLQTTTFAAHGGLSDEQSITRPHRIDEIYGLDGVRIPRVTIAELIAHDSTWFRATGAAFQLWCPIGRRLFVLYPSLVAGNTVLVQGPGQTEATYAGLGTNTTLRDEHVPYLEDLVEMLMHFRIRQLLEAKSLLAQIKQNMESGRVQRKHPR